MKRLDNGEFVADEGFIREELHKEALIKEVIGDLKYLCLDDQVAGLCYGVKGWKLMFYGSAVEKTLNITNKILETKVEIIENVKVKETLWRERPVIGGIDIVTEKNYGTTYATTGWVANKSDSSSSGIITVEHAVIVNGWVNNDSTTPSDRIATTSVAVNNVYVDASYSPFVYGINGSPSIKNLGNVVGWFGWVSITNGLTVSFNGFGTGGRGNTTVIDKGYIAGKYQQIAIGQELLGGDSGSACAHYDSISGGWVLVSLNWAQLYVNDVPLMGVGCTIPEVNYYTGTLPYLV